MNQNFCQAVNIRQELVRLEAGMAERNGRGAWPKDGWGGTLDSKGQNPGPYYVLADHPLKEVGLRNLCNELRGDPYSIHDDATFHGVLGIQALLIEDFDASLKGDGVFGPATATAVKMAQSFFGIGNDGVVGRDTMKWLLWTHVHETAHGFGVPWEALYGFLQNEGNWDPGAVGWHDAQDVGLAQINLKYHPETTLSEAFCPSYAIRFIAGYLGQAMEEFNGNIVDSIISYNLGFSGTWQWISEGRPTHWIPPWSKVERRPFEYAKRILESANL